MSALISKAAEIRRSANRSAGTKEGDIEGENAAKSHYRGRFGVVCSGVWLPCVTNQYKIIADNVKSFVTHKQAFNLNSGLTRTLPRSQRARASLCAPGLT